LLERGLPMDDLRFNDLIKLLRPFVALVVSAHGAGAVPRASWNKEIRTGTGEVRGPHVQNKYASGYKLELSHQKFFVQMTGTATG